ncbi:MAG: aspartate aminotransferase family protein [Saprospiraceae bacterium]|nr:aspartate aminotransferase family protein [Saprospiraceae bacterium]
MSMLDVYPLFNIEPIRGEGAYVYDKQGQKYLDFYGGHAVISIGHAHPGYVEALRDQAGKLGFYSNSVINTLQQEVDQLLKEVSGIGDGYDFFMINSGAEANENALKLASFSNKRSRFIALENGFHGRTAAAIQVTQKMKHRTSFKLDADVCFVPMNDVEALKSKLLKGDVCAVILEPIQGIGGVKICTSEYLDEVSKLTSEHGAIFIADEIQCGFGRSGKFFAHQYSECEPDIITIAKGMGNGFPVGGILVKKGLLSIEYGMAGTTFGGNHMACRATKAVLEVMTQESLISNARLQGDKLMIALRKMNGVKEVRGRGLMIGVEMEAPVSEFRKSLLYDYHVFTGSSSDPNVIRVLPPLNINEDHCDQFLTQFDQLSKTHF